MGAPGAGSAARRLLLSLAILAGCDRDLTGIGGRAPDAPSSVLGVMELTISGIGGDPSRMTALARPVPGFAGNGGPSFSLARVSGITLTRESTGSFTRGVRGGGGQRYFSATFRVTNASGAAVSNLTLVPMEDSATIAGTPFSSLLRFDGSLADPAIATQLLPTGAAYHDGSLHPVAAWPDVLQLFREDEVAALVDPTVPNPFPYGFVVRNSLSSSTRALGAGSADGLVTIAYRVPLQATSAQDPYLVALRVAVVQDSETKISQSLEEQIPAGTAAMVARAASLGAAAVVMPGNGQAIPLPTRSICSVRVAGSAAAPLTTLFPPPPSFLAMSPNPYAGAGSFIDPAGPISATFSAPATGNGGSFVVNGSVLGRYFLAGTFAGSGTSTVTTPTPAFAAGEEVEVTLTGGAGLCEGRVARLRVRTVPPGGPYGRPDVHPTGEGPHSLAVADVNGDLWRDVVTANQDGTVSVLLNTGVGGSAFAAPVHYPVGGVLTAIGVGDLNADGRLDVVVADSTSAEVAVLLGSGLGALGAAVRHAVGATPVALTVGDLNADGALDVATANQVPATLSVLLGDGAGRLGAARTLAVAPGPRGVVVGDMDRDRRLDLVVAGAGAVSVLLGAGGGIFAPPTSFALGFPAEDLAVGDLSGDGTPDVAVAHATGGVSILIAVPGSGFASPVFHPTGATSTAVAIGDRNGDGLLDVAAANDRNPIPNPGDNVSILPGTGGGSFGAPEFFQMGNRVTSLAFVDINRDGKLDLAVNNPFPRSEVAVAISP